MRMRSQELQGELAGVVGRRIVADAELWKKGWMSEQGSGCRGELRW